MVFENFSTFHYSYALTAHENNRVYLYLITDYFYKCFFMCIFANRNDLYTNNPLKENRMNNKYYYKENKNIIWKDYRFLLDSLKINKKVIQKLNEIINEFNLQIVFLILAYDKREDLSSIMNLIKLIKGIPFDNIHIALSFQGKIENNFTSVILINNHPLLSKKINIDLTIGKSENMLTAIYELEKKFHNEDDRTFIITLDSDYSLYDDINLISLFAPWVFSFYENEYKNVQFVKASGLFINTKNLFENIDSNTQILAYRNIIEKYQKHKISEDIIITPDNVSLYLSKYKIKDFESYLIKNISVGGRIIKAFDMYRIVFSDTIYGKNFNKIRCLFHGNQGTTLINWKSIPLFKGYGLELSFIIEFLYNKCFHNAKLVDCEILPLSHKTRSDQDSLIMGIKLFSMVKTYYDFFKQKGKTTMSLDVTIPARFFNTQMIKIQTDNELALLPSYNELM